MLARSQLQWYRMSNGRPSELLGEVNLVRGENMTLECVDPEEDDALETDDADARAASDAAVPEWWAQREREQGGARESEWSFGGWGLSGGGGGGASAGGASGFGWSSQRGSETRVAQQFQLIITFHKPGMFGGDAIAYQVNHYLY